MILDHHPAAARLAPTLIRNRRREPSPWFLTGATLVVLVVVLCWAVPLMEQCR